MDRGNFDELLNRYQRGETSIAENEQVEIWLAEMEPEETEWKNLNGSEQEVWIQDLRKEILEHIKPIKMVAPVPNKFVLWRTIAAAAAVLAVILSVVLYWSSLRNKFEAEKPAMVQVADHQTKKLRLPDGSSVWLNASATLQYPKSFDGKTREVILTGEAYFDIKHNPNKPFIVHTGNITTTVLGTAFNINANKMADRIIVTVTRGKVGVSDQHHLLAYVTPNQQLIYHRAKGDNEKLRVDAQKAIVWQDDLYFEDTTFETAAKQLEQRFRVRIAFANENMKGCRFSGTALGNKNLDEILTSICAINQASYSKNANGQVLISGNGCK